MTRFGYTLMTEQSGPKQLVDYAVSAERSASTSRSSSDHYSPWLVGAGPRAHTRGRCSARSRTRPSGSSCSPTSPARRSATTPRSSRRQAATLQILADGRFTLGVGSGENLNEHVVGKGWPTVARRQEMLREAIQIIRELFTGELVDWKGEYFEVDSARLWDVPDVAGRDRGRRVG